MTVGVYTALFGPYDDLLPAPYGGVVFTDQDINPEGWEVKQISPPHSDLRYASRYCFNQSMIVMPHCDYTIMHGANAQLVMAPADLVAMLPSNVDIGVFRHPHRSNVYDEAKACIRFRKDDKKVIEAQMDGYRADGFNGDGLSACILIIRRQTERLWMFEHVWWQQVKNGSYRDQLSFDYCRWRMNMPVYYLPVGWNKVFKVGKHNVH